MVRVITGTNRRIKTACERDFSKLFFIHVAGNEYSILSRGKNGEGGKEEEWHPTSVTPAQAGSLTASFLYRH